MLQYLLTAIIFVVLDGLYLNLIKDYFNKQIKAIQGSDIKADFIAVGITYVFLIFGINYFIIQKNRSVKDAALLGLVIYAVYEFTNLSLFKNWTYLTAFIDTIWGAVLFGLTTGIEKVVYQRMIDRLIAARGVNWGKFQEVHSRVKTPLKLEEGIVSVPGPKGAGDIQPAMLSPGEAVIPAEQSAKYMPLIQSMIADKVPGFAGPDVGGFGVPASLRPGGQYSLPIYPPGHDAYGPIPPSATSKTRLGNALTSLVRDKDIRAVTNFSNETARAAKESKEDCIKS